MLLTVTNFLTNTTNSDINNINHLISLYDTNDHSTNEHINVPEYSSNHNFTVHCTVT